MLHIITMVQNKISLYKVVSTRRKGSPVGDPCLPIVWAQCVPSAIVWERIYGFNSQELYTRIPLKITYNFYI